MRNEFLHGLIFGSGFTIAATVLAALALFFFPWDRGIANQTSQIMEESTKAFWSAEGVKVLNHEEAVRGDEVIFIGKLKNEGKATARNFSIEVELFDKDKKFVDVCRESLYSTTIKPGEERNFKGLVRWMPQSAYTSSCQLHGTTYQQYVVLYACSREGSD